MPILFRTQVSGLWGREPCAVRVSADKADKPGGGGNNVGSTLPQAEAGRPPRDSSSAILRLRLRLLVGAPMCPQDGSFLPLLPMASSVIRASTGAVWRHIRGLPTFTWRCTLPGWPKPRPGGANQHLKKGPLHSLGLPFRMRSFFGNNLRFCGSDRKNPNKPRHW